MISNDTLRTLVAAADPVGVAIDERHRLVFITSTKSHQLSSIDIDSQTVVNHVEAGSSITTGDGSRAFGRFILP